MLVEILIPPHMTMTAHSSLGPVKIVKMPIEEMCLEDMPQINVDLKREKPR